jgi:hypothetical protein
MTLTRRPQTVKIKEMVPIKPRTLIPLHEVESVAAQADSEAATANLQSKQNLLKTRLTPQKVVELMISALHAQKIERSLGRPLLLAHNPALRLKGTASIERGLPLHLDVEENITVVMTKSAVIPALGVTKNATEDLTLATARRAAAETAPPGLLVTATSTTKKTKSITRSQGALWKKRRSGRCRQDSPKQECLPRFKGT